MDAITTRHQAAEAWLRGFARAVRDRDYASAREMCRDDVNGFGTVSARYEGIDELQAVHTHFSMMPGYVA